jgi:hypothetical protein
MRFFETKSTIRARFTDTPHARSFAWRELKAADWDTHILKIRELQNDWQNHEARAKQWVAPEVQKDQLGRAPGAVKSLRSGSPRAGHGHIIFIGLKS